MLDKVICIDKTKLLKVFNSHHEINYKVLCRIAGVLNYPTLILKSNSVFGRIIVFGELFDKYKNPIMIVLELNPKENIQSYNSIYKIASIYAKQNRKAIQKWIDTPNSVIFIDQNKNRTINWLNGLGLQLPVPFTLGSYVDNISQTNENVKLDKTINNRIKKKIYYEDENNNNFSIKEGNISNYLSFIYNKKLIQYN